MSELTAQFEKRFPGGPAIRGELRLPADRFSIAVLFGPSGCGKSTILRCLAGLERPESGVIRCGEETWFDGKAGISLRPQQRGIGFLFQEYAIFPHLTVAENIAYGLRGLSKTQSESRVGEMLRLFGLQEQANRFPLHISGGQQQRVALARAVARPPRLLLLDEPLSALDSGLREQLRAELRRLLAQFDIPVVLVTHDRLEAQALADQIVVLDRGQVRQSGPAAEVFARPADGATARLLGVENVLPASIVAVHDSLATISIGGVSWQAGERELSGGMGKLCLPVKNWWQTRAAEDSTREVDVCLRAEEVSLVAASCQLVDLPPGEREAALPRDSTSFNEIPARVLSVTAEGPLVRVALDCGLPLIALIPRQRAEALALHEGQTVSARIPPAALHLTPR